MLAPAFRQDSSPLTIGRKSIYNCKQNDIKEV